MTAPSPPPSTHWFSSAFNAIADAPNGVARLRELILSLAVQGRLVPQDESDEPASELLKHITTEKTRLVKEGKLRKSAPLSLFEEDGKSSGLPLGWSWVRVKDIGEIHGGMTPSMNNPEYWEGTMPWVSPKDMKPLRISNAEMKVTTKAMEETSLRIAPPGSLLMVTRSGILKRYFPVSITDIECVVNQDLKVLVPYVFGVSDYLQLMLRGHQQTILTELVKGGTTVQSLKFDQFEVFPFPFPPLAEQKRIVACVGELMALCDELDARQTQMRLERGAALNATLNALSAAREPDEFNEQFGRLMNAFGTLFDSPESVAPLRAAILQLAVQGRLVEQDQSDEPASVLLERIAAQKHQSAKPGKSRKNASLSLFAENYEDGPFEIPFYWEWVRLGDIALDFQNGLSKRMGNEGELRPVLRLADIKNQRISDESLRDIMLTPAELNQYGVKRGDILIIRVNGSSDLVGRFVPCTVDKEWAYCDHMIRLRLLEGIHPIFLMLAAGSTEARFHIAGKTLTTAGQKTINQVGLSALCVPLPPLAEQKRIVARVDELMSLCDTLEAQLRASDEARRALAHSAVKTLSQGAST